jgi:putative spermidine/putrescine transport system ATP-binding protein
MQVELRQLQQRLGISTIVVTHDQREAMTMADIVVIMDHGKVQQVGSPLETYRNPANAFVADFIGSTNLLGAVWHPPSTVTVGDTTVQIASPPANIPEGAPVKLSVRPEDVHVRPAQEVGANHLPGTVSFIRDLGSSVEITVECFGQRLLAVTAPRERLNTRVGAPVSVELPANSIVVLKS